MDRDREITREELHQLVWSKKTPMVAKEFGLPDRWTKKGPPQALCAFRADALNGT